MKHHLALRIILLLETNGAYVPHDPRRSLPHRDVHGFVFAVVMVAALAVIVAEVIVALTVTATIILRD
jgi:hypothetical protein